MTMCTSLPFWRTMFVHGRRVPRRRFRRLLFGKINAKLVLVCSRATMLVGRPSVRLVAAAGDAVVAGGVEFLGVLGGNGKRADLTLLSQDFFSSQNFGKGRQQNVSTP